MSQELISPRNIQVDETNNNVRIVRRWSNSSVLLFTIAWNGLLFFFIWILFSSGNITFSSGNITSNMPIFANIIITLLILTAIYLIYLVIVTSINKTEIIANDEEISISHKPLFYFGLKRKRFRVSKLKDFEVKEVFKPGAVPGQYYCYEVYANIHTKSNKKLFTVASSKEAYFINKTLKKYYKIELEPRNAVSHRLRNSIPENGSPENETEIEKTLEDYYNFEGKYQKGEITPSILTGRYNKTETPKRIKIHQDDNQLKIRKKWGGGAFMAIFAILWNGSVIMLAITFANSNNTSGNTSIVFPFFLLFFSVGLVFIYAAIVQCLNYTYIVANKQFITVSYGPVPVPGLSNQQIQATQLKKLYSKVYFHRNANGQDSYNYIIHAKTIRGIEETLVNVDSREEALFIEKTLEDYYNIED